MKNAKMLLICLIAVITFLEAGAERSNGVIQRCGQDALNFLRWVCNDPTFKFPFPYHYLRFFQHHRGPYKNMYPFQSAAMNCCRYGCQESTYQKMCTYHKKIQQCEKRQRHYRTQHGRRKAKGACRLTRLN